MKEVPTISLLLALLLPPVCVGCVFFGEVDYAQLEPAAPARAPKPKSAVEVFKKPSSADPYKWQEGEGVPAKPFKLVALMRSAGSGTGMSHEKLIEEMQEKGAANGLDGVMDVECGEWGTYGQNKCIGKGFIYTR
jgi:hypothetical protein